RYQPDIKAAAPAAGRERPHRKSPGLWRTHAPGGVQRLYRHGPGTGHGAEQSPDDTEELPGTFRYERGQRLPVQSRDCSGFGVIRRDYGSEEAGYGLSGSDGAESHQNTGDVRGTA